MAARRRRTAYSTDYKPFESGWPNPPENLWTRAEEIAGKGSVAVAERDAALHILKRRLPLMDSVDHFRYVELVCGGLIRQLRAIRDEYRSFLKQESRKPVTEAYWRVFRFVVVNVAAYLQRLAIAEYLVAARVTNGQWAFLFDESHSIHQIDTDIADPSFAIPVITEELVRPLERLLGFDGFQNGELGGPFGREEQADFARKFYGPVFLSHKLKLPQLIAERQHFWDQCQPWTECLARFYDAVQGELSFQIEQLGPDAQRAEAEIASLSKLQRLVTTHLVATCSKQGKMVLGRDTWIALVRALDRNRIKLEDELRGNARNTLNVLRRKGVEIDTWEAAYTSGKSAILEDAKRHTLRREITKALLNVKRDAGRRLQRSGVMPNRVEPICTVPGATECGEDLTHPR